MELEFTIHLGFTIVALLVTLLILLAGTRNFLYRTLGLVAFVILLVSISFGYMDLVGKPKPLTYEQWDQREGNETLTMDVIEWEEDMNAKEAYLWMRQTQKEGESKGSPEYYSFQTDTEDGKELLKQLRKADQTARRRGRRSDRQSGIQLDIIIDGLWMSPKERFKFSVPPPKMMPEKTVPEQGIRYGTTSPTPMSPFGQGGGGRPRPPSTNPSPPAEH